MNRTCQVAIGIGSFGMLAVAGLMHATLAAQGTPITVTFGDNPGDQIGSDGNGPYVNGGDVEATFDVSGDLHFDTDLHLRTGGRTLLVAFQQPLPGCDNCNPPFQSKKVDAFMSTTGVAVGGKTVAGLLGMPVGTPGTANLNIDFPGAFVRFGPAYPGSTTVSVTRTDPQHWIITAAAPSQFAGLIRLSNNGKTETQSGEFYMPTEIKIDCPTC